MIKNLLNDDEPDSKVTESKPASPRISNTVLSVFDSNDQDETENEFTYPQSAPESMAETVRRSGLAYSAGIAFAAAVIFMLILGWGADVLLGSSPWGVVAGIVLGSIIGFIQLFRISSQIFKK